VTNISIFGLGYVGAVSAACLADNGHQVVGVDVNPTKVKMINRGQSPVVEEGMADLMCKGVRAGRIQATTDGAAAVAQTEVSFICVGTPSNGNGSLNLDYVRRVGADIGRALRQKDDYHVVVARSTMLPGSTEEVVIRALEEASGKVTGRDFGVCFNPEFLREGSSIKDFYDPPYTVVGGDDPRAIEAVRQIYAMLDAEFIVAPLRVAEMVKYAANAFHALKVSFANEIGNICKQQEIDSHQVMEIFNKDSKLNISPAYLKPGFAFGGSCLPKDLRAIIYHSRRLDLSAEVLEAILPSNRRQIDRAYQMIKRTGHKRVGVLGLSFKAGTDDLRESPLVELIERLIGKGYQVLVYDRNVSLAHLHGANRAYIEKEIPHIASLMRDSVEAVVTKSDVIVVGNRAAEFGQALDHTGPKQVVIDLVRLMDSPNGMPARYEGICW
jgi:GDP-mannose 6-dehydrogenase